MLEIVGVTGVVHMGQIHSGLRTGIRIAQGGHVSMVLVLNANLLINYTSIYQLGVILESCCRSFYYS